MSSHARSHRRRFGGYRSRTLRTRCELLWAQSWTLIGEALQTYEAPTTALDACRLEPRVLISATPPSGQALKEQHSERLELVEAACEGTTQEAS